MATPRSRFFILAGGIGERARPLSLIKPKPLFPLCGTPMLHILLEQMHRIGIEKGFVNLHHLGDAIRRSLENIPDITFLEEKKLSGSMILKQAAQEMEENELLLVVNGDSFMEIPYRPMVQMIDGESADGVLLVRLNTDPRYNGIEIDNGQWFCGRRFHDKTEKPLAKPALMYTGTALFKRRVLETFNHISFFDSLAEKKPPFKIKTLLFNGIWLDIGAPLSYLQADSAYRQYLLSNKKPIPASWPTNSLFSPVQISNDSQVDHCILWENTKITNGSILSHCIITGHITLNHVRAENKILIIPPGKHHFQQFPIPPIT